MVYRKSPADVTGLSTGVVEVTLRTKDSFAGCKEKGCSLCSAPAKVQKFSVPVSSEKEFEIGEFVLVSLPSINEAAAAFSAFILPLVVTCLVYLAVTQLLKWPAESGKSISALIVSFFLSFLIPVGIDRYIKKRYPIEIAKHGEC